MRRRFDPVWVLCMLLGLVTVASALAIDLHAQPNPAVPPTAAPLRTSQVVCPTPQSGSSSASYSLGEPGRAPARVDVGGAVAFVGTGAGAPGLVAGQWGSKPDFVTGCTSTAGQSWFTGLGAGPRQQSVVELANPTDGQAVVDLTLFGPRGVVDAPRLLGIVVGARSTTDVDLARETPLLGALSLRAVVVRGQVAVQVRNQRRQLAGPVVSRGWQARQSEPQLTNQILGIDGTDVTVTVANPADQPASVTVELVTPQSVIAPTGAAPIRVRPGATARVDLSRLLSTKVAKGTVGLSLTSDLPVVVGAQAQNGPHTVYFSAAEPVRRPAAVLVPAGDKHLVLGEADKVGSVLVESFGAQGRRLARDRVALTPKMGVEVDLPAGASRVLLTPTNTSFGGTVVVTGKGAVAVREPGYDALVPFVGPRFGAGFGVQAAHSS